MLRRSVVLTLCGLALIGPARAAGESDVPLRDREGTVALRVAHPGTIEGCPDCVLVDFREGPTRTAFYVKRETECVLRPEDAYVSASGIATTEIFLELKYGRTVHDRIQACLRPGPHGRVLASIDGVPAGVAHYSPSRQALYLVGNPALERIRARMNQPPPDPMRKVLERLTPGDAEPR